MILKVDSFFHKKWIHFDQFEIKSSFVTPLLKKRDNHCWNWQAHSHISNSQYIATILLNFSAKWGEGKEKRNRGRNDGMGKGCVSTCKTDMCAKRSYLIATHDQCCSNVTSKFGWVNSWGLGVSSVCHKISWFANFLTILFSFFQLQILSELAIYDTSFELLYVFVPGSKIPAFFFSMFLVMQFQSCLNSWSTCRELNKVCHYRVLPAMWVEKYNDSLHSDSKLLTH